MARKRKAARVSPPAPKAQVEEEESDEEFEEDPEEEVEEEEESEEDSDSKSESESEEEEDEEESKKRTVSVRNLLEPLGKDTLIDILEEAAIQYPCVLDRINQVADSGPAHRNIFVGGLGWDVTKEKLLSVFRKYGEIDDCEVVADKLTGCSKGYGFVLFQTRDGAQNALREREKLIGNRLTSCSLASDGKVHIQQQQPESSNRKIFVANVGPLVDPDRLRDFFAKFGELEEGPLGRDRLTGKLKKYAIFIYKNEVDCKKVLEQPYKVFEGCHLECRYYSKTAPQKQKVIPAASGGFGAAAIQQSDMTTTNYVPGGIASGGFGAAAVHQSDMRGGVNAAAIHQSDVTPTNYGMGLNPGMNSHIVNPAAVPNQRRQETLNRKIFVANVGPHVDPNKLRDFFAMYGEIEEGPVGRDPVTGKLRRFAIFIYKTEEGCKKALEEPFKVFEGCNMECRYYSKTTKKQTGTHGGGFGAVAMHQNEITNTNYVPGGGGAIHQSEIATTNYGMGPNQGIDHRTNPASVRVAQNSGLGLANPALASNQAGWSHSVPTPPGLPHSAPANSSPSIGPPPPVGFSGNYGINRVSPSVIGSYGSEAALQGLTAYHRAQLGHSPGAPTVTTPRPQSGLGPAGTPFPPCFGR